MSDLISRSKVISVLKQLEEHSLSGKMNISNAIYLLENQPNAYSVDKIVEKLEEQKSGLTEWAEDEAFKLATDKAIEIVKQEAEQ